MHANFKIHEKLMPFRVREILIVSSPYDAFIMEEDGGLMEHVFTAYRGVSLVYPPKFTVASSGKEALDLLSVRNFDLVITMSRLLSLEILAISREIKTMAPSLPIVLLAHSAYGIGKFMKLVTPDSIDKVFIWSGNRNILWTIVKWVEDRLNVHHDTKLAMVRVIIVVEDTPLYYSSLLPMLYESLIEQTENVLEDTLNEEHRLLKLRARPKILLATNYEEGIALYHQFRQNLLGIFSDIRYPRNGELDSWAGISFLKRVKEENSNIPCLLISSDTHKKEEAEKIMAFFMDKNSPSLHEEIKDFLVKHLGFGDYVFRLPTGEEVARASNLSSLEKVLKILPDESLRFHTSRNHFSAWLMARSEIDLATIFQKPDASIDIHNMTQVRQYLIEHIHAKRIAQQRGIVAAFKKERFDGDYEFLKIGEGSLGGKARGLAFMSRCILNNAGIFSKFKNVEIKIPQTLAIATDAFDEFIEMNKLKWCAKADLADEEITRYFIRATLPKTTEDALRTMVENIHKPLAVRSSSLLEDSQFQPYAGLYKTFMLPNNHADIHFRLDQLKTAVKLVYASVFFKGPKAFSKATQHRTEEEKMGVVVQPILGELIDNYYYPSVSGTAQSYNYYPVGHMLSEEGLANVGIGLGKIVVEEGQVIRFCPKHPQYLPQFSSVDEMLQNSQSYFYALNMNSYLTDDGTNEDETLIRRGIEEAKNEKSIKLLCSSYFPEDHRIRDSFNSKGEPVVTFASLLKYDLYFPFAEILNAILKLGRETLGCDFEMEFAFNLTPNEEEKYEFIILQIRPTATHEYSAQDLSEEEIKEAFCYSTNALGESILDGINYIIEVKPETFSSSHTIEMRAEVARFNAHLESIGEKYLLVGQGRWGSSDRMLGIPVGWQDISNVRAIVEASTEKFRADPSQGTHFFQNITSLGIAYITVYRNEDRLDWEWFNGQEVIMEGEYVRLIKTSKPIKIRIDAKNNRGIITSSDASNKENF